MSKIETTPLPIFAWRSQILETVRSNFVTIVIGETGSGKTTQIPQYVIDDGELNTLLAPTSKIRICVTQPRRVAASAMARRVAFERSASVGDEVGYAVRFDDRSSSMTRIKYVTDGVALREILETGGFENYNVFMIDEAHERSLNTDILFALIKMAFSTTSQLPPFRVIIASATLDAERFSIFFNNAPVLHIPGRCFPVTVAYNPITRPPEPVLEKKRRKPPTSQTPSPALLVDAAVNAALNIHLTATGPEELGHILVFLTGRGECESACSLAMRRLDELKKEREVGDAIVMPLYGALPSEDQALVFEPAPEGCRKIIFATNVAETSLTVEFVEFVIDSGYVKQKVCNPKTGMETLVVVSIAKSQAIQRTGRAGRVQSGRCFRLYSEDEFEEFPNSPELEIQRANLSSVVLQLKSLGLSDVLGIKFIDPPSKEAVLMSIRHLFLLGAVDNYGEITDIGKRMVSLPLDPSYSRCLLAGWKLGVAEDVAAIVAMLSVENIWLRPIKCEKESGARHTAERAERKHRQFYHSTGDHLTLLNVFRAFERISNFRQRDWCRDNYFYIRGLSQANDIYQQLLGLLSSHGIQNRDEGSWKQSREDVGSLRVGSSKRLRSDENDLREQGSRTRQRWFSDEERSSSDRKRRRKGRGEREEEIKEGRRGGMERREGREREGGREERILRSLCQGCFINTAKITSSVLLRSMRNTEDEEDDTAHVWVTLKDGVLVRCDRLSSLLIEEKEDIPEFVIFKELSSAISRRSSDSMFGMMSTVSRIKKEWISNLIARFSQVDLRMLTRSSKHEPALLTPDPKTPFKVQVIADPVTSIVEFDDQHPLIQKQMKEQIDAARERYLMRRKKTNEAIRSINWSS